MQYTYWRCLIADCSQRFKVSSVSRRGVNSTHTQNPYCRCGKNITAQTSKEDYDNWILGQENKRKRLQEINEGNWFANQKEKRDLLQERVRLARACGRKVRAKYIPEEDGRK